MKYKSVAIAMLLALGAGACSDAVNSTAPVVSASDLAPSLSLVGGGKTAPFKSRAFADMCIDVPAGAYANGTRLESWSCHGGANQTFIWKSSGEIVPQNRQTMCVEIYGGKGNAGDPITLWGCHGGANQRWTASGAGEIKGLNGRCIGLATAARANGTRLTLQKCSGSSAQKWDNAAGGAPPPPPPPPPPPGNGIAIAAGQSIQAAVNANPAGTTFIIKSGKHTRQSVVPKSGDRFIGEAGAVLDGQGAAYAFGRGRPPYPNNVTIQNLKITGYQPTLQSGTIDAGGYYPAEGTTGWVIDNNEVSYNGEYGIRIGNSTQITNNNVHHNKRLNVAGSGNNSTVSGNEIAFGNYLNLYNTNFEAGGTKFAYSDGLTLRNNHVHDNVGVGIHMDENNINTVIDGNRVERNGSEGIAIEISYKTTISNNTITSNGWKDPRNRYTYLWNAGIGIHASPNVEIYGNTVSGNYAGIVAIEQDRSMDIAKYGPHVVQNLNVHDNVVTQTNRPRSANELSVAAGVATDIAGNNAVFSSRNNRFVNNTYVISPNPQPFAWQFGTRTQSQWKGYGMDMGGSFK